MAETICQKASNKSTLDLLPVLCVINTGFFFEYYTMDKIGYPLIKNHDNKLVVIDFPNVTNFYLIASDKALAFYNLGGLLYPPIGKCRFFTIKKQFMDIL